MWSTTGSSYISVTSFKLFGTVQPMCKSQNSTHKIKIKTWLLNFNSRSPQCSTFLLHTLTHYLSTCYTSGLANTKMNAV